MTTLAGLHPALRAAIRSRLLTVVDVDHSPAVSVTLAQSGGPNPPKGVFTRASGSWLTAGFAAGQEVSVSGFTGSPLVGQVSAVTALALTTDIAGAETVAGGGEFIVGLPAQRAWEGVSFFPTLGKPYVAESYRPMAALNQSIGNGDGSGGVIRHQVQASFTLFYPLGMGTLALERMAGAIMAAFKPGVGLSRDGQNARVENVSRAQIYDDGAWIACAVTASFLAFSTS